MTEMSFPLIAECSAILITWLYTEYFDEVWMKINSEVSWLKFSGIPKAAHIGRKMAVVTWLSFLIKKRTE